MQGSHLRPDSPPVCVVANRDFLESDHLQGGSVDGPENVARGPFLVAATHPRGARGHRQQRSDLTYIRINCSLDYGMDQDHTWYR